MSHPSNESAANAAPNSPAVRTQPRVILASSSPSRRSILAGGGIEPAILVPEIDEDAVLAARADSPAAEKVLAVAQAKAEAVAARLDAADAENAPEAPLIVIAADSMLLLDGELQGKPYTVEATIERWKQQRGKTAELLTGHAILHRAEQPDRAGSWDVFGHTSRTTLSFAWVSDADIAAYARTGEPLYCAGAFTLEALGGWFIDRIEGDPSSVIGLSLPTVARAIRGFGYDVSDIWNAAPAAH